MDLDIPKSHLLITQILRNFKEKTTELNRLRKRIDQIYANLHRENVAGKLELANFECDPTLDEISTKKLAICVIGQSYEAKIRIVNDIFALKNGNVLEPTSPRRKSKRSDLERRKSNPELFDAGDSGLGQSVLNTEDDIYDISALFGKNSPVQFDLPIRSRLGSEGTLQKNLF